MNKSDLILIGGGGHCKSVIDVIETESKYNIIGILDVPGMIGKDLFGYKIIGTDQDIHNLINKGASFLVTIGHISSPEKRINIYGKLKELDAPLAKVISPMAYVSKNSEIGEGTIIMHHAFVNTGVRIGANCIINTKALIEHEVSIGNHCHISTGTVINGGCTVKDGCFIGSNSVLIQGIEVGRNSLVGAGAVVLKNMEDSQKIAGNPGRKLSI